MSCGEERPLRSLNGPKTSGCRYTPVWISYPKCSVFSTTGNFRNIDTQHVLPGELLAKITSLCTIVSIDRVVEGAGPDADDDKFLSCAMSANVHSLVSGDKHLLDLKMHRSIRILTARDFYEEDMDRER